MEFIIKLWNQLSPEIQAVLTWIFDKHLKETITVLIAFISWLSRRKLGRFINRFRARRTLIKKLKPDYTSQEIERGTKYYIWPECQSVDPAQSDEVRHTIAIRNDLCKEMDRLLSQDTVHKHFILLADTGMGKTSFFLNYFARHLRRWRKPVRMELIPLGAPGLKEKLAKLTTSEKAETDNTILLLDAFDEDTEAVKNHVQRLAEIMDWTRDFYRIVISCRTQFFPRDEEIPVETGIIKVGPKKAGESPQFTFYKIYLSPFSDDQIQAYLKRRFSFWQKRCRKLAQDIVRQVPNLAVRPMLLAYVDDLINSGKSFQNSFQIYSEMVEAWLERERRKVAEKEALSDFSNKLAVDLFLNRENRGGERIPFQEIEPLAKKFKIELETWKLAGRSLLNRDAEGNYKFAHRSIMEFLFATRIIDGDSEARRLPYNNWTEQIKNFVVEGSKNKSWTNFGDFIRPIESDRKFWLSLDIFVYFKGGKFKMGDTGKTTEVKPFEIAIKPVTNREYEEFDPSHREKRDKYSDQDDQPVVYVSWEDTNKYCQWLSKKTGQNYRLPIEAEWEFAASGGGTREYPWGNEEPTPEHANYNESKIGKTTPVGSYPLGLTPEGLFDMAGNVWEWCADWYDESKDSRVLRGGAFGNVREILRCAVRGWLNPLSRIDNFGFRVVRALSHDRF